MRTPRAGSPATDINSTTCSVSAPASVFLKLMWASPSSVTANAVPIWTADAPQFFSAVLTFSKFAMPPARMSGIFSLSRPKFLNTSKVSSMTRLNSNLASFTPATLAAPKCPAACAGCSITMASGKTPFFIQRFNTMPIPRDSDKIGNRATSL